MATIRLPRRRARPDVVGLLAGERPLAWADVAEESARTGLASATGGYWTGTSAALYLPAEGGQAVRIAWTDVEQADWDEATQRLRVRELAPFGQVGRTHTARLLGAERLLQLVRERVTAALVHAQSVPGSRGGEFRVLARRSADSPGELLWSVELPAGADPGDPAVVGEAAAALDAVRTELGISS